MASVLERPKTIRFPSEYQ
jgi:hypothetical protein